MKTVFLLLLFIFSTHIYSQKSIYKKEGIEVSSLSESNEFKDAKIKAVIYIKLKDTNLFEAEFGIQDYLLKADSKNNLTGLCANSKDGQHIHFIVDNLPYSALYLPKHNFKLDTGSHLVLSFLSRSHHQSLKHSKAFSLTQIDMIKNTKSFDLKHTPYLFYSRPKGTYVDNDTKEILLDFFLVNTKLSKSGNRVKIELDSSHIFYLHSWNPYLIKGLSMGEHLITMSLVNIKNKPIKSPFLPVTRKFILMKNP